MAPEGHLVCTEYVNARKTESSLFESKFPSETQIGNGIPRRISNRNEKWSWIQRERYSLIVQTVKFCNVFFRHYNAAGLCFAGAWRVVCTGADKWTWSAALTLTPWSKKYWFHLEAEWDWKTLFWTKCWRLRKWRQCCFQDEYVTVSPVIGLGMNVHSIVHRSQWSFRLSSDNVPFSRRRSVP